MHPRQYFPLCPTLSRSSSVTLATADDKAVKDELERQEGTWSVTSSVYDGQEAPEELVRSITRIVEGDHAVWERDGKRFAGTRIELDPTARSRRPST